MMRLKKKKKRKKRKIKRRTGDVWFFSCLFVCFVCLKTFQLNVFIKNMIPEKNLNGNKP